MRLRACAAAVAVVCCGFAGAVPARAASSAAYSITIGVKSNYVVKPYTLVVYRDTSVHKGLRWNQARVSGQVSGAQSGDTATLYAEPFGAKSFTAQGSPIALTGASAQSYSFTVQPTIATKYKVVVATGTTADASSSTVTVYLTGTGNFGRSHTHCSPARCTNWFSFYVSVPSSTYKTEMAKHWFFYLAVGHRRVPKYLYLDTSAKVSRARKINAGEFAVTFTFITASSNPYWWAEGCIKDSESRDGLGLPGHHGCGGKKLNTTATYIG